MNPIRFARRLVILSFAVHFSANAAPLAGTKSVGPTGEYASLTAAIADVNAVGNGLGGALVLELQASYVSTVETSFPLTIPALNGASAVNTLTIRPQIGATGLSISSADTTAATVDLNGAQFVTIDGRPGGTGTAKQLTIENISTAGVALRFINEGSNNTIKFVTLRGVRTSPSSGTVVFSTTTGANGNDNNTIDTCDIRDGASTPANGIYSSGTTTAAAQNNSGNTVSNCNLFNFYSSSTNSAGIYLSSGSTDWTVNDNSFYQTASRAAVAEIWGMFFGSGSNHVVANNFIGGTAPSAGGTAWTATAGSSANFFTGIEMRGSGNPNSLQGNTIQNMVWASGAGTWKGIQIFSGSSNVGNVVGNIVGKGTGTGSINVTNSGSGGTTTGISVGSSATSALISNNTIGSITTNGTTASVFASLIAINAAGGTLSISNNLVGSATTGNSLNAATSSTSTTGQQVTGILSSSSGGVSITGNTVANLNNNYVGTATTGQIRGIVTSAGVNSITGNSVRNLSTTSQNTSNATASRSVYGVSVISSAEGQTMSRNTVHSLSNTAGATGTSVVGIFFSGSATGTNLIARNFVHSLMASPASFGSAVYGIFLATGTFTAQNNLVRLGIDSAGISTAGASSLTGMLDGDSTNGKLLFHNSVYLGGTQTSGLRDTMAFMCSGTTNLRSYQNNIFVNTRSNGGGTGKHYAVFYRGTTSIPNGLTEGANIYYVTGTGGVLGSYSAIDRTTLAAWQAATGQDANSAVGDPLFVAPTGDASTVDLHLLAGSPAINAGISLAAVVDDYDGDPRSSTTPTIGADEFLNLYQKWAIAHGVPIDPAFNGGANLKAFAFGYLPSGGGELVYTGTFAGGGTITATGEPIMRSENIPNGVDFRALFSRRNDYIATGLTYTVQFSGDLSTWKNSTAIPSVLADDGTNQIVSVPYPFFVNGKKARFFKVGVSLAP